MSRRTPLSPAMDARILIADDQPDVLEALRLLLKSAGFAVETASSPGGCLQLVQAKDFDAALIDLNYARDTTSGGEGLDLLARLAEFDPALPVVVMTAWATVEGAVAAMQRGARDYVEKPWDNRRLLSTLRAQVEFSRSLRRAARLEEENRRLRSEAAPTLLGQSDAMRRVLERIDRVAASDTHVLITGEHGTGKEVVARRLHALSARGGRAWVAVNVGGLAEGLFESELFGHTRGAFTDAKSDRVGCFELADGGTLFLDEIGNLSLSQQARLLRVLQNGEFARVGSSRVRQVDVRVLSATNADLPTLVREARFREDLLFRLNAVEVHLPPLRERGEDIRLLAEHVLERVSARYGRRSTFSSGALRALAAHPWPGNVRELEHAVERGLLLASGVAIEASDLGLVGEARAATRDDLPLEELERLHIEAALKRADGNVSVAAERLGLSRSALYRRLERLGLRDAAE